MNAPILACGICTLDANAPAALPCGHIFCLECIGRAMDSVHPSSIVLVCPKCHSTYSLRGLDAAGWWTQPSHMPVHINATIRRIFPDAPNPSPRTISSTTEIAMENARLHAEISALRTSCALWRKRASAQASAMVTMLEFSQKAKEATLSMKRDRDMIYQCYESLRHHIGTPENRIPTHQQPTPFISDEDLPVPEIFHKLVHSRKYQDSSFSMACVRQSQVGVVSNCVPPT